MCWILWKVFSVLQWYYGLELSCFETSWHSKESSAGYVACHPLLCSVFLYLDSQITIRFGYSALMSSWLVFVTGWLYSFIECASGFSFFLSLMLSSVTSVLGKFHEVLLANFLQAFVKTEYVSHKILLLFPVVIKKALATSGEKGWFWLTVWGDSLLRWWSPERNLRQVVTLHL